MKQKSLISQLAKIHNGTITHRELALNGVSRYSISKAVQDGTLERNLFFRNSIIFMGVK